MRKLALGSHGPRTALLQLALARAGYAPDGGADGFFETGTYHALIAFQKEQGLPQSGIAGDVSWRLLEPWLTGYAVKIAENGDTAYSLASRYGSTIQAIETANPAINLFCLRSGEKLLIPFGFPVVPTDISFGSALMDYCIRGLCVRYPFLKCRSIGRSVLGRDILCIDIGEGSRRIFYNASHHAEEWITSILLMKFLENYADAYAKNEKLYGHAARRLYETSTLSLVPLVNPDGVDLAAGWLGSGSAAYIRALAMSDPAIPFPRNWRSNINGVDLNLQYPAGWERAKKLKFAAGYTKPGPRDYVGLQALSEPESRAVYELTRKSNFDMALAYHTQGEVIYWKYLDYEPKRAKEIGEVFSALSCYKLDNAPAFSAHAGYKDWFIKAYMRPAYTVEAGYGTNPLPLSDFDTIYRKNIGILTYALA